MTDETVKDKVEEFRARYAAVNDGLPEAGGIAFCTVYLDGTPINVTARANNPYDALASLKIALKLAQDGLGIALEKGAVSQAPQKPANNAPVPPTGPQEAPGAPQPPTQGIQTMSVTKLEIEPQADGKAKLKFYAAGHKYPDLHSTLPVANCITALADVGAWTQEYFEKAGSYDVGWLVDWKNSDKRNSKGNPYKDLVRVRLP